jgi:hypothetical protein
MPAATSLIIAGASAAASAGQAIAANKRRKEAEFSAKDAAAKLRGISETDYSAGLQVPTMGYDLAQQGVQQQVATGVQALQDAGAAGVIGGLPTLTEQSNRANLELGADLQNQEYQRDLFRAENRQAIDQRRALREADIAMGEVEGAQMAASENRQIANQAVGDIFGAASLGYGQYLEAKPLYAAKGSSLAKPTVQQAVAPFQAGSSALKAQPVVTPQYGPMMNPSLAPAGTRQFGNSSYAPGATPYGYFPGLVTPFKG